MMGDDKIRPVKVLHVVHSLDVGGLENGVVNLINRLDSDRFCQIVCCLTRAGKLVSRIERQGTEVLEVGHSAKSFRFPLVKLAQVFGRISPDIVHTRGWAAVDAVFAARLARVPAVIHGEHGRDWNDTAGVTFRRNQVRRLVGLMVDRYVVVCNFFRNWLRDTCKIREEKILHIPNGVDTRKFAPLAPKVSHYSAAATSQMMALRKRLSLPTHGTVLGTIGRLDPVKDFDTLLGGFARARSRFPETRLVIVGDGPMRQKLIRVATDLGVGPYVSWLGEREDIPVLLRCFDLYIQSSIFEGMSNTILEAMASGLPVVATRVGGTPELVDERVNGRLVPAQDPVALGDALVTYIADPMLRASHRETARQRTLERFDLSRMVTAYRNLYLSLAVNKR
jgi:sugar transferase (PEP-CTERM/EpsH1 system associated)